MNCPKCSPYESILIPDGDELYCLKGHRFYPDGQYNITLEQSEQKFQKEIAAYKEQYKGLFPKHPVLNKLEDYPDFKKPKKGICPICNKPLPNDSFKSVRTYHKGKCHKIAQRLMQRLYGATYRENRRRAA